MLSSEERRKVVFEIIEQLFGQSSLVWDKETGITHVCAFKTSVGLKVAKLVIPLSGEKFDSSFQTPEFLNESTKHFRNLLKAHDVPLSKEYQYFIADCRAIQISSYEGKMNVKEILLKEPAQAEKLIIEVLKAIKGVLYQSQPPLVGIDAKIDNFTIDDGIIYIDTFPPLCKYKEKYLVHYPNPCDPEIIQKELERKFEAKGILRRLRSQLLFINPALESFLLNSIKTLFENPLKNDVIDFFSQLPDRSISDPQQTKKIIEDCPSDADTIREIAARIIPSCLERTEILNQVFRLSSIYPSNGYPISPEERIMMCKKLLLEMSQKRGP